MRYFLAFLLVALAALPLAVNAGSMSLNASLHGYLSQYIPNATISGASYYNASVGSSTYVIMQLSNGTDHYIVVNTTRNYSAMMNASNVSKVLGPFLAGRYYPNQSTLDYLASAMGSFRNNSRAPINDCLLETGLANPNTTCTFENSCFACQTTPICKNFLNNYGGPTSTVGGALVTGIMGLEGAYPQLNSSYNNYFSALAEMSPSTAADSISEMSAAVSEIGNLSVSLPQNPLFPLPTSMFSLAQSTCLGYAGAGSPWYCQSLGMCEDPGFNTTLLSNITTMVASLAQSPLSSSGLASVSTNSSKITQGYVGAVIGAQQNETFAQFLSVMSPQYNSTAGKSEALLSMFSNASLQSALSSLKSTYSGILGAGSSQNLTTANTTLANAIVTANTAYNAAYAVFEPVYTLAQNNNYKLAIYELSYEREPAGLAKLALQQRTLNEQMNNGVSTPQLSSLKSSLRSVSAGLLMFAPVTLGAMVKSVDNIVYSALLSGSASLASKNASAALYCAVLSLIVGIVLLLLFYLRTYARLKKHGRLRQSRRAQRAWTLLFAVLIVLLAIYVAATYIGAVHANAFLPVSGFVASMRASPATAVVLNTTSSGALACAASVKASLNDLGRAAPVITLSGTECSSVNASFNGTCMGSVIARMPVVIISSGSSGIAYRGMYGHVLYASGSAASGSACSLKELFSR